MSVTDMVQVGQAADRELAMVVTDLVAQHGVPSNTSQSMRMARDLHPQIVTLRKRMYRQMVLDMGRDMARLGLEVMPAPMDFYDVNATYKMITWAVGLAHSEMTVPVQFLDEKSQRMVTRRVSPHELEDPPPEVVQAVTDRILSTSGRHVRAAGRNLVVDTSEKGTVRRRGSRSRLRTAYARVLTGVENCPFCAMLASRGAVYSSDTVTRRRDGRAYHNNCDCVARLVVEDHPWEGQEEADRLYDLWRKSTSVNASGLVTPSGFFDAWRSQDDLAKFTPVQG